MPRQASVVVSDINKAVAAISATVLRGLSTVPLPFALALQIAVTAKQSSATSARAQ